MSTKSTHSKRSSSEALSLHRIPHLAPKTQHISASRVRKSWRPLPLNTQDRVKALLAAIQAETLATLQEPTRKTTYKLPNSRKPHTSISQADTDRTEAVTALIARLDKSVPKMSFPPPAGSRSKGGKNSTSDMDLSLLQTHQRTAQLSSQLSQTKQSSKILRLQLKTEEADLKRDRAELAELERNYRANVLADRRRGKDLHELARDLDGDGEGTVKVEEEDGEGIHELASTARMRSKTARGKDLLGQAQVEDDTQLKELVGTLRNHLGSLKGNTSSLSGLKTELRRTERDVQLWALRNRVGGL